MKNFREKIPALLIFVVLLLIYTAFPTKNYYWDGIEFAFVIENAGSLNASLFHPNHLFYNPLGYVIYKFVQNSGFDVRAITVLQVMNSVFSALSAIVLFYILKQSFRSNYLAAALTFLFSFSAVWWKFSTDANSYIPSIFFTLVCFYLILPNQKPKPLPVALIHTIAMCFHQLAVFFFPVAVLGLFFQTSDLPARKRFSVFLQYGAMAFVLTFGLYCLCFYLQSGNFDYSAFIKWLTNYSPENGFLFNLKKNLEYTLGGEIKLFFGGRFGFLKEVINPLTILLMCVLAAAFVALSFQIIRFRKCNKTAENSFEFAEFKELTLICAAWASVYLIFLFFWIPQNTFYRMFYLPAFIVLIGILLSKYRPADKTGWRTALFVVILFISNFLFYIYPYSKVRSETPLSLAVKMQSIWSPNAHVYFSKMDSDNRLLRYYNPDSKWIGLDGKSLSDLESEVRNVYAGGGEVWMETSAVKRFMQNEDFSHWLKQHGSDQSEYRLKDSSYDMTVIKIYP